MRSILDKSFRYVPAANTNVAATFARIRKQMALNEAEAKAKTVPLKRKADGRG